MSSFKIQHLLWVGIALAGFGSAGITLNRFPPVNFDEVANVVVAHEFTETGRVRYPMSKGVIDPAFEELSSSGQEGLRGLYTWALSWCARAVGFDLVALRGVSFLLWCLTGWALFVWVRRAFGAGSAWVAVALSSLSFDGILCAHLVRPDIWLGLALVVSGILMEWRVEKPFWSWMAIGSIAAGSLGFHPHGAILLVWALLGWRLLVARPQQALAFTGLMLGALFGAVIVVMMIDPTTYVIGKYSYVSTLYSSLSFQWLARLSPLKLIKDSVTLITNQESFYFSASLTDPFWRKAAGLAIFSAQLFAWAYAMINGRKNRHVRFFLWSAALFFFGVGYGHLRNESIYVWPITLTILPLAGWTLEDLLSKRRQAPWFAPLVVQSGLYALAGWVCLSNQLKISSHVPPLTQVFASTETVIGRKPERLLGPNFYWFYIGQEGQFRDIDAIFLDHLYSGQKRADQCVHRYRPDVMIVNEEFRRRFQLRLDPKTRRVSVIPLDRLLKVSCDYLGSLDSNAQHTRLDIYRLNWKGR